MPVHRPGRPGRRARVGADRRDHAAVGAVAEAPVRVGATDGRRRGEPAGAGAAHAAPAHRISPACGRTSAGANCNSRAATSAAPAARRARGLLGGSTGVLTGGPGLFFDIATGVAGGLPLQPWAAALKQQRMAANSKDNPDAHCLPLGNLQLHTHPQPRKIVQTADVVVVLYEGNAGVRQLFTDGRPLPANEPQPWWFGYSTGRWVGDTLVVETAGFRDGGWLDVNGSPLTDRARDDGALSAVRATARWRWRSRWTIPKAYTRPWTVTIRTAADARRRAHRVRVPRERAVHPALPVSQRGSASEHMAAGPPRQAVLAIHQSSLRPRRTSADRRNRLYIPRMPTPPCIITAAITGSVPRKENNPAVPITVSEQIESTHACYEAGAALVHVHVRNDDQSTTSNPDKFAELPRAGARALPGHDRAVLHRRPLGRRLGARRDAAPEARHGVALHRVVQLSDPRLREPAGSDPRARRQDDSVRRQARDRGVRSRDALQRRQLRPRGPARSRRSTCSSCSASSTRCPPSATSSSSRSGSCAS